MASPPGSRRLPERTAGSVAMDSIADGSPEGSSHEILNNRRVSRDSELRGDAEQSSGRSMLPSVNAGNADDAEETPGRLNAIAVLESARKVRERAALAKKKADEELRKAIRVEQEAILALEEITAKTTLEAELGPKLTQPEEPIVHLSTRTDNIKSAVSQDMVHLPEKSNAAVQEDAPFAPAERTETIEESSENDPAPKLTQSIVHTDTEAAISDITTTAQQTVQPPTQTDDTYKQANYTELAPAAGPVKRKRWKQVAKRKDTNEQSPSSDDESDEHVDGSRTGRRTKRACVRTSKGKDFFQGIEQRNGKNMARPIYVSNPNPWTKEEELRLIEGYDKHGYQRIKWDDIAKIVQTRAPMQCKQHWTTEEMRRRVGTKPPSVATKSYPPSSHALTKSVPTQPTPSPTITTFPQHRLKPTGFYRAGIVRSIEELGGKKGWCSREAIKKHMMSNMKPTRKWVNSTFLSVIKGMVPTGELVSGWSGGSYKLSAHYKTMRAKELKREAAAAAAASVYSHGWYKTPSPPKVKAQTKMQTPSTPRFTASTSATVDPRTTEGIWSFDKKNTKTATDISNAQVAALAAVLKQEDDKIEYDFKEAIILAFDAHRKIDHGWLTEEKLKTFVRRKLGRSKKWAKDNVMVAVNKMVKSGYIQTTNMQSRWGELRLTMEFKRKRSSAFAEAFQKIREGTKQPISVVENAKEAEKNETGPGSGVIVAAAKQPTSVIEEVKASEKNQLGPGSRVVKAASKQQAEEAKELTVNCVVKAATKKPSSVIEEAKEFVEEQSGLGSCDVESASEQPISVVEELKKPMGNQLVPGSCVQEAVARQPTSAVGEAKEPVEKQLEPGSCVLDAVANQAVGVIEESTGKNQWGPGSGVFEAEGIRL